MFLCCHTGKRLEPVAVVCCTFFNSPFFHLMCNDICNFHRQLFAFFYGFFQFFVDLLRETCLHDRIIKHIASKSLYYIDILTHFSSPFYLLMGTDRKACFPHFWYFSDKDSVPHGSSQYPPAYGFLQILRPASREPLPLK